jgi:hypothetical protein
MFVSSFRGDPGEVAGRRINPAGLGMRWASFYAIVSIDSRETFQMKSNGFFLASGL